MSTALEGQLSVALPKGKTKAVPVLIERPEHTLGDTTLAVCLLHGAGGDADSGNLPALAAACAAAGIPCLRFTCRGGNLQHRIDVCKGVLAQAASLPGLASVRRFVLSGHSMGARVACAVTEEQQQQQQQQQRGQGGQQLLPLVLGCMLFSYPLHPPGKPGQLRDALLTGVRVPTLLVRGSKDPFSQQAQWDATLARMASPRWEQHTVQAGDHSLHVSGGGGAGGTEAPGAKRKGRGMGGGNGGQRSSSEVALEELCAAVKRFLGSLDNTAAGPSLQQQGQQHREQQQQQQQQHEQVGGGDGAGGSPCPPPKRRQTAGRQSK